MSYEQISLEDIHFLLTSSTEYVKEVRPDLLRHFHSVRTNFKVVHEKPGQFVYEYVDWDDAYMFSQDDAWFGDIRGLMYKEWVVRR